MSAMDFFILDEGISTLSCLAVRAFLMRVSISAYDKIEKVRGFDVCIVTTANSDEEAKELLTLLGMPFVK